METHSHAVTHGRYGSGDSGSTWHRSGPRSLGLDDMRHSGCWPRHLSWLCPSHVWKHTSAATWMMHNHPWFCQRKRWIAATFWCHFVRRRRRMWWSPDTSGWCLFSSLSETIRGWKRLESDLLIYPGPSELICAPRFIMIHFRIRLVRSSGRMQLVVLDAEGGFVAGGLERVKNATALEGFLILKTDMIKII